MRTEADIRAKIAELDAESQQWLDYENVLRLMRSQIKGLKYALGEEYNISSGK